MTVRVVRIVKIRAFSFMEFDMRDECIPLRHEGLVSGFHIELFLERTNWHFSVHGSSFGLDSGMPNSRKTARRYEAFEPAKPPTPPLTALMVDCFRGSRTARQFSAKGNLPYVCIFH